MRWGFCGGFQAEIAAREAKSEKLDSYAAARRKRDEEREEEDRLKVSLVFVVYYATLLNWVGFHCFLGVESCECLGLPRVAFPY